MIDVLIIGAGPSGAAVAWKLSRENKDLKIVCLEQGGYVDPSTYPSNSVNWESAKYSSFSPDPNVRASAADYPIDCDDSSISIANYNAVGGSSILYSGHFPRFHPSDFRVRSLDGVADDWPISYKELEPYYELNDSIMGVAGLEGDPAYPPISNLLPPVPLGRMGERLAEGFNKLGWHWWPSYAAIATRRYANNRSACVNMGPCNLGCPLGAKASIDVTYWPLAIKNGVEIRTHSCVSRVAVDDQGAVCGVEYFDPDGVKRSLASKVVVMACNGVGTPRILLNSSSEKFPQGLANSSGLVGKNLMLHPLGYAEGLFDEQLNSHLGPQGCSIYSHEFYETNQENNFFRGSTLHALRGPGPLETAINGISRREIKWGSSFYGDFDKRFGRTANIAVIVEDLPEEHNSVQLSETLKDRNGIPAPKVNYKLSDNSKKILSHGLNSAKKVLEAAGATKIYAFGPVRNTGWHLMGTAKMGEDSNRSVVNSYGQSHDHSNLFIADSSIFVTSGAVNPMSTLQAVALRVADGITDYLSHSK